MGKVKVQGKIMDARASNAGRADQDMLYTPTNGMLYDKERFIDIQLFHKGIGELGENINMINQGLRAEIDEFGYGQRITQPFIAQSLMDRQKQRETQREIESDMITQGKINLLRQQGLLRDEERLGTFLPSQRNGMRREVPVVQRQAVEDMKTVDMPSVLPSSSLTAGETSGLSLQERLQRMIDRTGAEVERLQERHGRRREVEERAFHAPEVKVSQEVQEQLTEFLNRPMPSQEEVHQAIRNVREQGFEQRFGSSSEPLQGRRHERTTRIEPGDPVPGTSPFSLFD